MDCCASSIAVLIAASTAASLTTVDLVSIAAVQGHAIGAGFQLALACDLRVVADDVQFAMRETSLGLVPDLTGTHPLARGERGRKIATLALDQRELGIRLPLVSEKNRSPFGTG